MMAVTNAVLASISWAIPAATGTNATMVPTLVPIDIEMKHDAMNRPAYSSFPGRTLRARFTVASIAPISLAVDAKAPASTNIHIIRSTFLLPAPSEKILTLSSCDFPRVISIAYIEAMRKAAEIGTL